MSRAGIVIAAADRLRGLAMSGAVRDAGWREIDVVESAAEAVRCVRRGNVGCVVVASELSDVTGAQGVPILRAADATIRIIFAAPAGDAELERAVRVLDVFYYHIEADGPGDLVEAVAAAVGEPRSRPERPCVLVADDDPAFREAMRILLEAEGHRVIGAGSAAEALRVARAERPHLVVADIMMESPTEGLHLLRELRKDPGLRHTPLVAVSAVPRRGGLDAAISGGEDLSGADAYFAKPVDAVEFAGRVRELLGRGG